MRKEDYTVFSSELLKEKLRRTNFIARLFLGSMILMTLTILTFILLGETQEGFAGLIAIFTPFTVYFNQKAKTINAELCKRAKD